MLSGLILVILSFFRLPMRFLRMTADQLREIARTGVPTVGGEGQLPFLNWIFVAGRIVISTIAVAMIILLPIIGFATGSSNRILGLLGGFILAVLVAFVFIWFSAVILEQLSLAVVLVNNTRQMVSLLGGSPGQAVPPAPVGLPPAAPPSSPARATASKEARCTNCGESLSVGAAFCTNCGARQ